MDIYSNGYYFDGINYWFILADNENSSLGFAKDHIIDIKTLGQYTGLKDDDGIEVYENDIIEKVGWEEEYHKIVFNDYGFKFYNLSIQFMPWTSRYEEMFSANGFKVVGNIHDNEAISNTKFDKFL